MLSVYSHTLLPPNNHSCFIPTSYGHMTKDWLIRCFCSEFLNIQQSRMESGEYISWQWWHLHISTLVLRQDLKCIWMPRLYSPFLGGASQWIHELNSSMKSFFTFTSQNPFLWLFKVRLMHVTLGALYHQIPQSNASKLSQELHSLA